MARTWDPSPAEPSVPPLPITKERPRPWRGLSFVMGRCFLAQPLTRLERRFQERTAALQGPSLWAIGAVLGVLHEVAALEPLARKVLVLHSFRTLSAQSPETTRPVFSV